MAPIYLEFIFHTERQGCFPSSFGAIKSLHRGLFFFVSFFVYRPQRQISPTMNSLRHVRAPIITVARRHSNFD